MSNDDIKSCGPWPFWFIKHLPWTEEERYEERRAAREELIKERQSGLHKKRTRGFRLDVSTLHNHASMVNKEDEYVFNRLRAMG
jgi:hypothetical protein